RRGVGLGALPRPPPYRGAVEPRRLRPRRRALLHARHPLPADLSPGPPPPRASVPGAWRFFPPPILPALILPLALLPAARLAARRWMPLAVLALVIIAGGIGALVARIGFEALEHVA